jgi:hypothetical protein
MVRDSSSWVPRICTTILWNLVFLRRFSTTHGTEETEVLIEKGISRVTNGTKERRRECGLWVFNLRPSLNLVDC